MVLLVIASLHVGHNYLDVPLSEGARAWLKDKPDHIDQYSAFRRMSNKQPELGALLLHCPPFTKQCRDWIKANAQLVNSILLDQDKQQVQSAGLVDEKNQLPDIISPLVRDVLRVDRLHPETLANLLLDLKSRLQHLSFGQRESWRNQMRILVDSAPQAFSWESESERHSLVDALSDLTSKELGYEQALRGVLYSRAVSFDEKAKRAYLLNLSFRELQMWLRFGEAPAKAFWRTSAPTLKLRWSDYLIEPSGPANLSYLADFHIHIIHDRLINVRFRLAKALGETNNLGPPPEHWQWHLTDRQLCLMPAIDNRAFRFQDANKECMSLELADG